VYRELPEDDPMQRCPDIALARKTLGWEPRVALDDGLSRTIAYFDNMLLERGAERVEPAH
jgi:UDP-glucuronate decarboxylase